MTTRCQVPSLHAPRDSKSPNALLHHAPTRRIERPSRRIERKSCVSIAQFYCPWPGPPITVELRGKDAFTGLARSADSDPSTGGCHDFFCRSSVGQSLVAPAQGPCRLPFPGVPRRAARISSTDPAAKLPATVTFVNGRATVRVTFATAGKQTLSVSQQLPSAPNGSIVGSAATQVGEVVALGRR